MNIIGRAPRFFENRELYCIWKDFKLIFLPQDEPASSGDSGDESGSEPESPSEKLLQQAHKQDWIITDERDAKTNRYIQTLCGRAQVRMAMVIRV